MKRVNFIKTAGRTGNKTIIQHKMQPLLKKPQDFTVYENGGSYILSVVCETPRVSEINIQLNEKEKLQFFSKGVTYINHLAREIKRKPATYLDRHIIF